MKEDYLLTSELEPTNEPYAIAKIAGIKMCESYNRQYGTSYRSVMPTNLYGPGDNYHLENSHVIPAMIRKFHLAKLAMEGNLKAIQKDEQNYGPIPEDIQKAIGYSSADDQLQTAKHPPPKVILWGTGQAYRELLHVDDMATACIFVMKREQAANSKLLTANKPSFLNVGTGEDQSIKEMANMIKQTVGFEGEVLFDSTKPDGTPKKLLATTAINSSGWKPEYDILKGLRDTYNNYTT